PRMPPGVAAGRGRVTRLSFFIHNFLAPCAPETDRIEACVFAVAPRDGPVSMCPRITERLTREEVRA
ncbi:MAG: hypothetical protein AB7G39_18570, partial [Alphaproteobacteria bacterium]